MSAAPHLAVDVRMMHHAGIGVYIRNLLPRVIASLPSWRFTLLCPGVTAAAGFDGNHVACDAPIYTIAEQLELPRRIPRDADLFWSPHYNVPMLSRLPLVVTIHDVAHLARPERTGIAGMVRNLYARRLLTRVRDRAVHVLFDSQFSSDEFQRFVGRPRASTVVPIGVDPAWHSIDLTTSSAPPRPYILFVGSVKPHKNVGGLLLAFESLAPMLPHDLVIAGNYEGMRTVDRAALDRARMLGDRVRFLGRIGDDELRPLVARADVLVLPSFYEGFGLPPVEAMAAGVPCVVSDIPAIREVCGDAAQYCDPMNPEDIARQIQYVLTDRQRHSQLVELGRTRSAMLDWASSVSRTVSVLEQAASETVTRRS